MEVGLQRRDAKSLYHTPIQGIELRRRNYARSRSDRNPEAHETG